MTIPVSSLADIDEDGSDAPSLVFGTWRTPSATRPVLSHVHITVDATGVSAGQVDVEVDESGGSTADRSRAIVAAAGNGVKEALITFKIQPGMSYRLVNTADPTGNNAINSTREWVL